MVVGTAQWGIDYGITNDHGRLSEPELEALITLVTGCEIRHLDTAPAYGDAESRIGQHASGFLVQSKISVRGRGPEDLLGSVRSTTSALRDNQLHGLLVHDWSELTPSEQAMGVGVLEDLRAEGIVDRVGVSAYSAADVESGLMRFERMDLVQVPASVLDQRLAGHPAIDELRERGGVVQARSAYLQGLLVDASFDGLFGSHPDLVRWRALVESLAIDPVVLALAFIREQAWIDELVVGSASARELAETMAAWGKPVPRVEWVQLASEDPMLIDPRQWPATRIAAG